MSQEPAQSPEIPREIRPEQVPFVVGITGHMDIDERDVEALKTRIAAFFDWLRAPLPKDEKKWREINFQDAKTFPKSGLGLKNTPILVLSSLAPGADTIFAEVALEKSTEGSPVIVRAPLPYSLETYRKATTFCSDEFSEEEKARKLRDLDGISKKVGKQNCFPVRMRPVAAESAQDSQEANQDERDEERKEEEEARERRRHYQAAGEYVASFSHLLVSIVDEAESKSAKGAGASDIERFRLEGFEDRLLPVTSPFTWADCGEVIRLPITRGKRRKAENGGPEEVADPVNEGVKLILPAEPGKAESSHSHEEPPVTHLARMAREIETFNKLPWDPKDPLCEFLKVNHIDELGLSPEAEKIVRRLERPITLRWKAAELTRKFDGVKLSVMRWMAILAAVAALMLHLFSHWHLSSGHGEAVSISDEGHHHPAEEMGQEKPASADHESDGHLSAEPPPGADGHKAGPAPEEVCFTVIQPEFHDPFPRAGFVTIALILVLAISVIFRRYRNTRKEPRRFDYRALAEGLRVQIFWCLSGMPYSVAYHYLHRQKREIDWLRYAISCAAFPYEPWRRDFEDLTPDDQRKLLSLVKRLWVSDQKGFYARSAAENLHKLHAGHLYGWGLTLAGILSFGVLAILCWVASISHESGAVISQASRIVWKVAVGLATAGWALHFICAMYGHGGEPPKWLKPLMGIRLWYVAAAVSSSVILLIYWFAAQSLHYPVPALVDWWIVLSGALLVLGAIRIAWTEKQAYAEHARNYDGMHHLFAHTEKRLTDLLTDTETAKDPRPAHASAQEIIRELGKEALNEHAEWLVLHKVRPTEPFLAG